MEAPRDEKRCRGVYVRRPSTTGGRVSQEESPRSAGLIDVVDTYAEAK
jgi:hypothetical protein